MKNDSASLDLVDIDSLQENFTWVHFQKRDPAKNIYRYYSIGWVQTLFDPAVVRIYGRIGGHRRIMAPEPFDSLDEAWPTIRKCIEQRLKRGYQLAQTIEDVEPLIRMSVKWPPSPIEKLEQAEIFDD